MRYDWPEYIPVAVKRERSMREVEKLRKKGLEIEPVVIEGRTIVRSFWGKGWCQHLEKFSDFSNRLPRGRSYVRNGSVCHLKILPGRIEAMVCGSSLYKLSIEIKPLKPAQWKAIKQQCQGQISSLLELLEGRLSERVMAVVADRETGLFPKPKEIHLNCNCPDWATMCKHVAAVLYGVGNRLDHCPELLFTLRGVDAAELIDAELVLPGQAESGESDLAEDNLAELFGIDLETEPETKPVVDGKNARKNGAAKQKKSKAKRTAPQDRSKVAGVTGGNRKNSNGKQPAVSKHTNKTRFKSRGASKQRTTGKPVNGRRPRRIFLPEAPTGRAIARLRTRAGLSRREFAEALDVTQTSLSRWENTPGPLNLQLRPLRALARFQEDLLGLPRDSDRLTSRW